MATRNEINQNFLRSLKNSKQRRLESRNRTIDRRAQTAIERAKRADAAVERSAIAVGPPAPFSVSEFVQTVSAQGLARQNRFQVEISNVDFLPGANDRNITLLCQSASLPGATIVVKKQTLFGPAYIRPGTINYGETLNMTFLVDKNMTIKNIFDRWMHYAVQVSSFTVAYRQNYARDIIIKQLDEAENVTYEVRLIDAFPVSIGALALNQSALDRFHQLPITFAYRYWETLYIPNSENYDPFVQEPRQKLLENPNFPRVGSKIVDVSNIGEVASSTPGSQTNAGGRLSDLGFFP